MAVPETPNDVYIAHIQEHRQLYNPVARWYEWQPRRTGKLKLCRQNDVAYTKLVKKNPGLHEQHLAEELHRFSVLPVQYKDQKGTVTINPSIPPMGDPIRFHGTQWTGKRFDDMWMFWTQVYPAHAHDIEMELVTSRTEERKAWWDIKWTAKEQIGPNRTTVDAARWPTPKYIRDIIGRKKNGHFELTYLDNPCRVCGGLDHPALTKLEDSYGDIRYSYVCRMAAVHDWETTCMRPCPEKMARVCQYDEEEVEKACSLMITDGWGQFQSNKVIRQFLKMAKLFCQNKGEAIESS